MNRFLITRPHPGSGIGSNLASLAGAVWYAGQSGRAVIVDWRNSAFLKNKSLNYFTEFFETPAAIQGVPVRYAPCPELPEAPDVEVELTPAAAREALRREDARRHLALGAYHGLERLDTASTPAAQFWRLKAFYDFVTPRDFIRREIDAFADQHFREAFIVGVNLSSGNGEFDSGPHKGRVDLDIFSRDRAFLRKVERARRLAVRGLPRPLRADARIFFATDSFPMRDLLQRLPNAVTRRRMFPPPGAGRIYCDYNDPGYSDRDAVVDALVDMFLLGRCHALVRNGSVFNLYACTVSTYFNGNVRHIESLYARYWVRAAWNHLRSALRR